LHWSLNNIQILLFTCYLDAFVFDRLNLRLRVNFGHPFHEGHRDHFLRGFVDNGFVLKLSLIYLLTFLKYLLLTHLIPLILSFHKLCMVFMYSTLSFRGAITCHSIRTQILIDELLANLYIYLLCWHWNCLNDLLSFLNLIEVLNRLAFAKFFVEFFRSLGNLFIVLTIYYIW